MRLRIEHILRSEEGLAAKETYGVAELTQLQRLCKGDKELIGMIMSSLPYPKFQTAIKTHREVTRTKKLGKDCKSAFFCPNSLFGVAIMGKTKLSCTFLDRGNKGFLAATRFFRD